MCGAAGAGYSFEGGASPSEGSKGSPHSESHHGQKPLCSGSDWGTSVGGRLALFVGHHAHVHLAHLLHRAAGHRELRAGPVGDLRGPGPGGPGVSALQRHAGPAAGHQAGSDPYVRDTHCRAAWLPAGHPRHAAGQQLPQSS